MPETTRTEPLHRTRLAAVVLAAAAIAGACSGDSTGGSADPARATSAATATTGSDAAPDSDTAPGSTDAGTGSAATLDRYADYSTVSYTDPARWLCRGQGGDGCEAQEMTVVIPTAVQRVVGIDDHPAPPVDCFYLYPTISRDPTPTSDWDASPDDEGAVVRHHVAQLSQRCRVFAPVYRQRTLGALADGLATTSDPYEDVLDAWKTYMATDNEGRGVVLIGHSQGAALLNRLIAEEIDPHPDVRAMLVSAYLAGWSVAVPDGQDVGGDFDHVPLCRTDDASGCVVTWSSFRDGAPPPDDAFFGKPRTGDVPAACTNPASLTGGAARSIPILPADRSASFLAPGDGTVTTPWIDPAVATVTTPFVVLPDLVTVECTESDGFHYLKVSVTGDPSDPRADDVAGDLTPQWGLHLLDIGLVLGNIDQLIASQTAAWEATR